MGCTCHDGRIRAIAVTGPSRAPLLPATPTFADSGLPGYEVDNWYAVLAPRGTADATIGRLNAAIIKGLAGTDARRRIAEAAAQPVGGSPAQLAEAMHAELEKWARVVRAANSKVE